MNNEKTNLFQRDFTLVVFGQIISLFGNAILRFALPLYLLRETGSSALFGAVTACSFIPMIVLSLMGGVLADRINKRNIMVILDFCTAGLIGLFYLGLGRLPVVPLMIVFLMLLYGISGVYQPAVQASIPVLVKTDVLMQGNAVINIVSTLSNLIGPVIGGILFGMWGILPILAIGAACFTVSAVMEIFIHIPYQKQTLDVGIFATVKNDLKESFEFVKREKPVFFSVAFVLALFNLVLSAAMIVGMPIMIIKLLGMGDESLGFAQGALGLGGLAGGCLAGIVASKMKLRHNYVILLICALTAAGMGIALLPQVPKTTGFWIITAMAFIMMAASMLFTIQMCTVVQRQTPPHLIGKIMATTIAIAGCAQPLGQAMYGICFDIFEDTAWLVMGVSAILAFIIGLYSKKVFIQLEKEN